MDGNIWKSLPFEIMEIVFIWLPLSVLARFRGVCKHWNDVLKNPVLLSQLKKTSIQEFGFLVPSSHYEEGWFIGSYLNDHEHISCFSIPFIDSRCQVESTIKSLILLSTPTSCSKSKNYFIMNPFTKTFTNMGSIWIGDRGFFFLLEKVSSRKYEWVVVKHVQKRRGSAFYIFSSIETVWKKTKIPCGLTAPPKEVVFYKNKIYWLYLDKEYEDYPTYGYTIYWLDIFKNEWGFSFVPIPDIRSMSLALYKNQLVCLINDGSISAWSIEEVEGFQFGQPHAEWTLEFFEDDWGFKWNKLCDLSIDMNHKCPGYLPLHSVHDKVLLCHYVEVPFVIYDLLTGASTSAIVDDFFVLQNSGFYSPSVQHVNDLIEIGNFFTLIPNTDFVDDMPPLIIPT